MARVVKTVAIVIKDKEQLAEGLRTTAGLLIENHTASMFVLRVEADATEKYKEDLEFIREMDALTYSDVKANADNLGFELLSTEEIVEKIRENEIVVPF
jgi:hypothetical protein